MDNPSVVVGKWVEGVVLGDDWSLHTFKIVLLYSWYQWVSAQILSGTSKIVSKQGQDQQTTAAIQKTRTIYAQPFRSADKHDDICKRTLPKKQPNSTTLLCVVDKIYASTASNDTY
ncbi:hypothetical protein BDEG_25151 [Batrachochytrium dendrobatidis JEL423]|uniref:Uncharacterized protein n=1 Tax=Batrachochytrium dendrobatidis (strain JEL423) TaxID=403673 RepID=A0A177WP51_BATDL|nr:hypothetical protein BDEG_25151 [Batrachochytrium dendrobatidis JEL423]